MRRALLLLLALGGATHAQTVAAPAGTQINPNLVIIGQQPGQVAGGDALAAETTRATQAEQALAAAAAPQASLTAEIARAQAAELANATTAGAALPRSGGTMTGLITLSGAPTATLHAATKGYVDNETTRAQGAEGANASALTAETTRAKAAEAIAVVNRPTIAPLTTAVSSTPTTIYSAGAFVSILIKVATPGAATSCTGDGGSTSGTATYPQDLRWPTIVGGAMPPGPIVCTGQTAISTEAH